MKFGKIICIIFYIIFKHKKLKLLLSTKKKFLEKKTIYTTVTTNDKIKTFSENL